MLSKSLGKIVQSPPKFRQSYLSANNDSLNEGRSSILSVRQIKNFPLRKLTPNIAKIIKKRADIKATFKIFGIA